MVLFSLEFFSKKIPFSTFSHTSQKIHSYIHLCIFWSKNPLKNLIKAMDLIFRKAINIHIFSHNSGNLETPWVWRLDMNYISQFCPIMAHTGNAWRTEINGRGCSRMARVQLLQVLPDQLTAEESPSGYL